MCGVAGAFLQPDGARLAQTMVERIAHRGPDAVGVLTCRRVSVQLGHRRLSIIDLSTAADQPFVSDGLHLSYNGGCTTTASCGTSCGQGCPVPHRVRHRGRPGVLAALGAAGLSRLRGMFAFALYDERAGALTLVRDPLGIKPLYVLPRKGGIVFASELKALVTAVDRAHGRPGSAGRLDDVLLPARGTLRDKEVYKLPAGSWAEWRDRRHRRSGRYWDPAAEALAALKRPNADLAAVFEESVAAHMVADAGGLLPERRSGLRLVTAMAANRDPSIEAYTITFRPEDQKLEAMPDDATYARKMAAHLGIRLHEIEINRTWSTCCPGWSTCSTSRSATRRPSTPC